MSEAKMKEGGEDESVEVVLVFDGVGVSHAERVVGEEFRA